MTIKVWNMWKMWRLFVQKITGFTYRLLSAYHKQINFRKKNVLLIVTRVNFPKQTYFKHITRITFSEFCHKAISRLRLVFTFKISRDLISAIQKYKIFTGTKQFSNNFCWNSFSRNRPKLAKFNSARYLIL